MKDFFLERQLKKIEREANDDFLLVIESGPTYYSTHELQLLLIKMERLKREYIVWSRRLFLLGASVFLWIGFSILFTSIGWKVIGYSILAFIPFTLAGYLFFFLYIRRKYHMCRNARIIESIIRQEINRRKDAPIF